MLSPPPPLGPRSDVLIKDGAGKKLMTCHYLGPNHVILARLEAEG